MPEGSDIHSDLTGMTQDEWSRLIFNRGRPRRSPRGSRVAPGAYLFLTLRRLEELSLFLAEARRLLTCLFFTTCMSSHRYQGKMLKAKQYECPLSAALVFHFILMWFQHPISQFTSIGKRYNVIWDICTSSLYKTLASKTHLQEQVPKLH